jgi:hypothetical protein
MLCYVHILHLLYFNTADQISANAKNRKLATKKEGKNFTWSAFISPHFAYYYEELDTELFRKKINITHIIDEKKNQLETA